jgi:hypothetical protein
MSRILSGTGEIEHRFAKRAVDTSLTASTILQHGFGSEIGRKLARQVSELHKQYDIHPDDFVLIGCDTPLFSLEMAERYGWRAVTDKEREALRILYDYQARAFGSRKPLPGSMIEMKQYLSEYFDTQLYFEPQNLRMAKVALDWYVGLAPLLARKLVRKIMLGVLDPRVVRACGLPVPGKISRLICDAAMRMLGRRDPIQDGVGSDPMVGLAKLVYPNGYDFDMLGPQCPVRHSTKVEA